MSKIKIRLGCFETNSSSTHSLTLADNLRQVTNMLADFIDETFEDKPTIINNNTLVLNRLYGADGQEEYYSIIIISSVQARLSFVFLKVLDMVSEMNVTKISDYWTNGDGEITPIHSAAFKDVIEWIKSDDETAKDIWQTLDTTIKNAAKKYYGCDEWSYSKSFDEADLCFETFYSEVDEKWTIVNYKQKIKEAMNLNKLIVHADKPYTSYANNFKIEKF